MEQKYETPAGYYDVPFLYAYDASGLTDGQDYTNLSILIERGFGDFICRRMAGIQGVVNPTTGQYQFRDSQRYNRQIAPVYAGGGGIDDYAIIPEIPYPELTTIQFDVYNVLRADPPIEGTYTQTEYFNPAALSLTGNVLCVAGTSLFVAAAAGNAEDTGQVLIYTKSDGVWGLVQTIDQPVDAAGKNFGFSLFCDGTTLIVGAPSTSTVGLGAAYIYTKVGPTWTLQQEIAGSDETSNSDQFGVSVWASGTDMLVGADQANVMGGTHNGVVYYFTFADATWTQQQKFTQTDIADQTGFGRSIAVAPNGTTALIGAIPVIFPDPTPGAFYCDLADGAWTQTQAITQPLPGFGFNVTFGDTGSRSYIATGLAEPAAWFVYDLVDGVWTLITSRSAGLESYPNNAIIGTDTDFFIGCTGPDATGSIYHFQDTGSGFNQAQIIDGTTPTAGVLGLGIALAGTTLFGGNPVGLG